MLTCCQTSGEKPKKNPLNQSIWCLGLEECGLWFFATIWQNLYIFRKGGHRETEWQFIPPLVDRSTWHVTHVLCTLTIKTVPRRSDPISLPLQTRRSLHQGTHTGKRIWKLAHGEHRKVKICAPEGKRPYFIPYKLIPRVWESVILVYSFQQSPKVKIEKNLCEQETCPQMQTQFKMCKDWQKQKPGDKCSKSTSLLRTVQRKAHQQAVPCGCWVTSTSSQHAEMHREVPHAVHQAAPEDTEYRHF